MAQPLALTFLGPDWLRQGDPKSTTVATQHFRHAMRDLGLTFQREFVARRLSKHSDDSLGVRTGAGRRSFAATPKGTTLKDLRMEAGFGPPAGNWSGGAEKYMGTHETGATIKPKHAKFLAIPVAFGLTGAGVARFASPRNVPKGFFIRAGKRLMMFMPQGKTHSNLVFYFKRSVTIPERLHFADDWNKFEPRAVNRLHVGLQDALDELAIRAATAAMGKG